MWNRIIQTLNSPQKKGWFGPQRSNSSNSNQVSQNGEDLSTSAKLELYAFFKQATCGHWEKTHQTIS